MYPGNYSKMKRRVLRLFRTSETKKGTKKPEKPKTKNIHMGNLTLCAFAGQRASLRQRRACREDYQGLDASPNPHTQSQQHNPQMDL